MPSDVVKDLGLLTLGTRLKRLGDRLQAQTQPLLEGHGIEAPVSLQPVLAALHHLGPLSVGDMALALGLSQPAVTRQLTKLQAMGWVSARLNSADLRLRTVELTPHGREQVDRAHRLAWPRVRAAVADACGPDGQRLLDCIAALEDALAAKELVNRATAPATSSGDPHAST